MADPLRKLKRGRRPDFGAKQAVIEARLAALIAAGQLAEGSVTARLSRRLQDIAGVTYDAIEAVAGERVDFSLVVWSAGRLQYVSTANRDDVKAALQQLIASWDAGMPDIPAHEVM